MKILTTALFAFSLATPALSATIYSAQPVNGSLWIVDHFSDSSFHYNAVKPDVNAKDFCFVGELKDVCSALQNDADAMVEAYMNGGHDTIEVLSCEVGQYSAKATYRLTDDWDGDITVEREISSCGTEGAEATILHATLQNGRASLSSARYYSLAEKPASLCYSGKREAVCAQIESELAVVLEEYLNGAHDYQELNSCVVDAKTGRIQAEFTLVSDYDAEPTKVSHEIEACLN